MGGAATHTPPPPCYLKKHEHCGPWLTAHPAARTPHTTPHHPACHRLPTHTPAHTHTLPHSKRRRKELLRAGNATRGAAYAHLFWLVVGWFAATHCDVITPQTVLLPDSRLVRARTPQVTGSPHHYPTTFTTTHTHTAPHPVPLHTYPTHHTADVPPLPICHTPLPHPTTTCGCYPACLPTHRFWTFPPPLVNLVLLLLLPQGSVLLGIERQVWWTIRMSGKKHHALLSYHVPPLL